MTGFAGSHLAEHLLAEGREVYGTSRTRSDRSNIAHIEDRIKTIDCDIADPHSVEACIKVLQPDEIYHLAAMSYVPDSWNAPLAVMAVNVGGTINVLEAARWYAPEATVLVIGSSEEYGMVKPEGTPITEDHPLLPMSPYGVSKVAADLLGRQCHESYGMKVVRTRAFNHEGPRRGARFVTSQFCIQAAEIVLGRRDYYEVGNLDAVRDFTDARDTVRAYRLAVEKGEPGEVYNIAQGVGHKISELLELVQHISGTQEVEVVQDPARMRPSDVPLLLGASAKFRERTGWKPEVPFEKTMTDMYTYWLERIR